MESLEISAKTVEDAVEQALAKLGKSRDEVDIEVLSRGKSGLLGLGAEDARVRVTLRPPPSPPLPEIDVALVAKETLELMLAAMGMDASVDAKAVPQDMAEEQSVSLALDITGEDLGILIGRRGETLTALQYLVNLMVSRRLKAHAGVMVDVEGYRERRRNALRGLALRLADRVSSTGRSVTLEPMPSLERRIVHLALRDHPDVITESIGDGESRKVTITPKQS